MTYEEKSGIVIAQLRADRDRLQKALDKIKAEIEALNPVDYVSMSSYEGHKGASDMKDDVLRIIDKYTGSEG
jgi:hypothetical protein